MLNSSVLSLFIHSHRWQTIREYITFTIGLTLVILSWNIILLPAGLMGGGFTGISTLIFYATGGIDGGGIPISYSYLAMNLVLLIIAFVILGPGFSIKTIYGVLLASFLYRVIPIPSEALTQDMLMNAIAAGMLSGVGAGTYLLSGGSSGGNDIIVMIISKYKNISWGKIYLIFDVIVISSLYILPDKTIESVLYGLVFMGVSAFAIDLTYSGIRQNVQMFIFTRDYKAIANELITTFKRGATVFPTMGWYTQTTQHTLYVVCRKRMANDIFKMVKELDETSFITVSPASSVFGAGFEPIKAGFRSNKKKKQALEGDQELKWEMRVKAGVTQDGNGMIVPEVSAPTQHDEASQT